MSDKKRELNDWKCMEVYWEVQTKYKKETSRQKYKYEGDKVNIYEYCIILYTKSFACVLIVIVWLCVYMFIFVFFYTTSGNFMPLSTLVLFL